MKSTNTPVRLWDYCWDYCSVIQNYTASPHIYLDNLTPHLKITGSVPNMSEFLQFKWFDFILYLDLQNPLRESLGRYLGPAEYCGEEFTSYILTKKRTVIVCSTTRPLSTIDKSSQETISLMNSFMKEMESFIGNTAPSTMRHHEQYQPNPYETLFPPDQFDDENIAFEKKVSFFRNRYWWSGGNVSGVNEILEIVV